MSRLDGSNAKERVLRGLKGVQPRSFLVEVPPGCELHRVVREALDEFRNNRPDRVAITEVVADVAPAELEFIDQLLAGWRADHQILDREMARNLARDPDLAGKAALLRFVRLARDAGIHLVAFLFRFEKLFERMTSTLLATLREIETSQGQVSYVIEASQPYDELYRQRARTEPTFTSDYGQTHIHLRVGALDKKAARKHWTSQVEPSSLPEKRMNAALFELAFEASGGLPVAFQKATNIAALGLRVPEYRAELMKQLPATFARLFKGDPATNTVLSSLARLQVDAADDKDLRVLVTHPLSDLMIRVRESGRTVPLCEPLAIYALESGALGRVPGGNSTAAAAVLYRQGRYTAAVQMVEGIPGQAAALLKFASQAMQLAFPAGRHPGMYFSPDQRWRRLADFCDQAAEIAEPEAREEFSFWSNEAMTIVGWPSMSRGDLSAHFARLCKLGQKGIEQVALLYGGRILACEADANVATACQMALPVPESLVRAYIVLVLKAPTDSTIYAGLTEDELRPWWTRGDTFERPQEADRLPFAHLLVAGCALSAREKRPLLPDGDAVQRALIAQDSRNVLGHELVNSSKRAKDTLLEQSRIFFNALCDHTECKLDLATIKRRLSPPSLFLRDARFATEYASR